MTLKESYDAKIVDLAGKYYTSNGGKSKRLTKKKLQEAQLIVEYIESVYTQESKDLEVLSKKTSSLSDIEQRYSSY